MESKKIDLDSFIVKEGGLNEKLLAEIIAPYVERIFPDGQVEYKDKFRKLNAARKLLIEVLIKKVKTVKQVRGIKSEKTSMKELIKKKGDLGVSEGSIKKSFNRELKNIIRKDDNGEYYVPNYTLQRAKEYLEK